ncbi:COG1361 S-layer family protein [Thermococcus prieurii]
MRRVAVFTIVLILLLPLLPGVSCSSSSSGEPGYLEVFSGYLGMGRSISFGNYTLTLVDFLYGVSSSNPIVLFKLRDNSNFSVVTFSLQEGQSFTYGDIKITLVYLKQPAKTRVAYVAIYSRPTTVFSGTTGYNSTFSYGPVSLSVLGQRDGKVFMRYYRDGFVDYAYFGPGPHYWHEVEVTVYNVTNESVSLKILAPKYIAYIPLNGAAVVVTNVSFPPVEVGGIFGVNITIKNVGDQLARFVKVSLYTQPVVQSSEKPQKTLLPTLTVPTFTQEIPFAVYREGPVKYTDVLAPGQTRTLHFLLIASKTVRPDVYPLYIKLQYTDENGIAKEEEVEVGIPLSDVSRPKVEVVLFKSKPSPVSPSSNFTLSLAVSNVGNAPAYNVKVAVLPSKPQEESQSYSLFPTGQTPPEEPSIYPIGRQSVLYFKEIPANGTVKGNLSFAVKDVSNGIYPLYVVITYYDENGVEYKSQATFGVHVEGFPKLKAYVGNVWMSDGRYNFEVDIANDGKAPARGVTVSISSPTLRLFPLGERYVGSVEPMDYDSVNFVILNSTLKAGRYPVVVRITYMTPNGRFVSFNETLEVQIPAGIEPSKDRRYYYLGAALAVLLIILLWRRGRG